MEEILEEIKEETPVYVLEDSIPDILEINNLREAIEIKEKERNDKQEEVNKAADNKKKKAEEIGIINTGEHIDEVTYNLRILSELNDEYENLVYELEDLYHEVNSLNQKLYTLTENARRKVEEFTAIYNEKKEKHIAITHELISNFTKEKYDEAVALADELNKFKKFSNFNAILEKGKLNKSEDISVEDKNEEKVEEAPIEEKSEELTEVKVDSIESNIDENIEALNKSFEQEPEVVEEKIDKPGAVLASDAPAGLAKTSTLPVENESTIEKVDEILNKVEEVKEDVPSFNDLEELDNEAMNDGSVFLTNRLDKIADSSNKGLKSTISTFNSQKEVKEDKTLTLSQ